MKNNVLLSLYKRPETVFTLGEIALMFPEISRENLKERMSYFAAQGAIGKVRKGIYVKDNYDPNELANKLYSPSYVSLETVLLKEGIIFQYSETIFLVSYLSRQLIVDNHNFVYKKIKDEVLFNHQGIEKVKEAEVASKERAFLDTIFLYKNYYFDNLGSLDWEKIMSLKEIYASRIFNQRVNDYYRIYKEEHV